MTDLSDKTALCVDNGLFVSLAIRLGKDFGKVYYCNPSWVDAFPKMNKAMIGHGFDEIEVVDDIYGDHFEDIDVFCYDDQTEVLTENGWKLFKDVGDETVATLSPDGNLEYQLPTGRISYRHTGELISVESCRVNFAVTPNHRMYVRRQRSMEFEIITAENAYGKQFEFDKTARWIGLDIDSVTIPETSAHWTVHHKRGGGDWKTKQHRTWPEIKCSSYLFLGIAGFYLAEGSLCRRNNDRVCGVEFGQKSGKQFNQFVEIVKASGFPFSLKKRKSGFNILTINSTQIGRFFEQFGEGVEKRIPKWIKILSPNLLRHLYEFYMKGDGLSTGMGCSTVSRTLADDLQEVILKLGYSCSEKPIQSKWFKAPNGHTYLSREGFRLNISRSYHTPVVLGKAWKRIPYNGQVYCLTVPNGLLYVRRNGVPIWCGNCFPDVYFGELQMALEIQGKLVWGARMGEELELHRDATKELMKELKLPVGPWNKINGFSKLREFLKENKNQFVKVNKWRGVLETFHSPDYRSVEPKLDEVEYGLGAFKDTIDFIVEESLDDKVEIGVDAYTIDGKFPKRLLSGIEVKDTAYVGIFKEYDSLPKVLTGFDKALTPTLEQYGYRGFYSSEIRVGKDHVPYMIDFCARAGSPPSELYQEFYKNISQIIWDGANGICTDPIPESKYGAELLIHSSWADKNFQPVDYPDDIARYVKLRNAIKIKGRVYVIPQAVGLPEIGSVIGFGDTLDKAMEMCIDVASKVEGYYIITHRDSFNQAQDEIEKLDKFGIKLF